MKDPPGSATAPGSVEPSGSPGSAAAPGSSESGRPSTSGLRNPAAAVRGVGAAALGAEGVVLLLAIQPIRVLGATLTGVAVAVIITLAVASFLLAGLLRRRWAWAAGGVLQVVLFGSGLVLHAALAVLGGVFGLVWIYVLQVRRRVLR